MQLTVRDVSGLLNVSEKTVYRWIKEDGLPSSHVHGQHRFNQAELLDWASARKIQVPPEILSEPDDHAGPPVTILDGLLRLLGRLEDSRR